MKAIVDVFINKTLCGPPENFEMDYFEVAKESITDFSNRNALLSPTKVLSEFQGVLLSGLADSDLGRYSQLHDSASYVHGYNHDITIRLAYMYVS